MTAYRWTLIWRAGLVSLFPWIISLEIGYFDLREERGRKNRSDIKIQFCDSSLRKFMGLRRWNFRQKIFYLRDSISLSTVLRVFFADFLLIISQKNFKLQSFFTPISLNTFPCDSNRKPRFSSNYGQLRSENHFITFCCSTHRRLVLNCPRRNPLNDFSG